MPEVAESSRAGGGTDSLTPAARENFEVLSEYQDEEDAEISRAQSVIEAVGDAFGSIAFFLVVIAFSVTWIAVNAWGVHVGWKHVDEPPFFWLQGTVSFSALLLTVAVLIRQNRMSKLATRRAHLDLHVNLLTEKKVSKVLEELAELRKALGHARPDDQESKHLATAADPKAILGAIKQSEDDGATAS